MRRLYLLSLMLLVLSLAFTACGSSAGNSGTSDAQAVRDVVLKAITTNDGSYACTHLISRSYILTEYGTLANCEENYAAYDCTPATCERVSKVQVIGSRATAEFLPVEDATKPRTATVVKEEGRWVLDSVQFP